MAKKMKAGLPKGNIPPQTGPVKSGKKLPISGGPKSVHVPCKLNGFKSGK
jgi:hypothetical protein